MKRFQKISLLFLLLLGSLQLTAQCGLIIDFVEANCTPNGVYFATLNVNPVDSTTCEFYTDNTGTTYSDFGLITVGPFQAGTDVTLQFTCISEPNCQTEVFILAPDCNPNVCGLQFPGWVDTLAATCGNDDGGAVFQISGDQYVINVYDELNVLVASATNGPTVGGLGAGFYSYEILCADGSVAFSGDFAIHEVTDFFASILLQPNACVDWELQAAPADAGYTYLWSTGESTQTINVPGGDSYSVTVTNPEGCSSVGFIQFLAPAGISINPDTAFFNPSCGLQNGGIFADVTSGSFPITYTWSNGATTSSIFNLGAGTYSLTVTDANGCTDSQTYVLEEDDLLLEVNTQEFLCDGSATLQVFPLDSVQFFTYVWTDASGNVIGTESTVDVSATGNYDVLVTNTENGCTGTATISVIDGGASSLEGEIQFVSAQDSTNGMGCDDNFLALIINGGIYWSEWTLPDGSIIYDVYVDPNTYGPGMYIASALQTNDICPPTDTIMVQPEDLVCVNVSGTVFLDQDADCDLQNTDVLIPQQQLRITHLVSGQDYFTFADQNGNWSISLPEGSYEVNLAGDNDLLELCNPVGFTLVLGSPVTDKLVPVIGTDACPRVTVDLTIPILRRCFNNGVYLNYENTGTVLAEDVVITVEVGDFASEVTSWFGQQPDAIVTDPVTGITTVTFSVGDLQPFEGGQLNLLVFSCSNDFPINSAACVTATATPNNPCPPADPDWSGASLRVAGTCAGDSVTFNVLNVGENDMTTSLNYIVIEDGVILTPNGVVDAPIAANDLRSYTFPANGATYHFQVDQEPLHPGLLMPIDFVEGCGPGQTSTGFALQFPLSDDAYWIDEECLELIGSYDPNDKRAMPRGYSDDRFIEAGQMLDYTIRFQNTGNDTAFTVIVRDTLSEVFDLSTLVVTGSTHPMQPRIDSSGRSLAFFFENILLVDSFTNEPGSHGAVHFRIQAREDLAPGTMVENTAAIYFDFNDPVITNTYQLQVEEDFVAVGLFDFQPEVADLRIFPNPTAGPATIKLPAASAGQELQLEVYDALGRRQLQYSYQNNGNPQVDLARLPAGWYTLRLTDSGQILGTGRVLLQK